MSVRLHERDHELGLLRDALDAAADGRGNAMLLEGAAGLGKTSVIEQTCEAARERSFFDFGAGRMPSFLTKLAGNA